MEDVNRTEALRAPQSPQHQQEEVPRCPSQQSTDRVAPAKPLRSPPAGRASGTQPCPYRFTYFPKTQEVPNLLATGQEENEGTRRKGKGAGVDPGHLSTLGQKKWVSEATQVGTPPDSGQKAGDSFALGAELGVTKPHPPRVSGTQWECGGGAFPFLPLLSQDAVQSPWAGLLHCSLYLCPRGQDCRSLEHFSSMM